MLLILAGLYTFFIKSPAPESHIWNCWYIHEGIDKSQVIYKSPIWPGFVNPDRANLDPLILYYFIIQIKRNTCEEFVQGQGNWLWLF